MRRQFETEAKENAAWKVDWIHLYGLRDTWHQSDVDYWVLRYADTSFPHLTLFAAVIVLIIQANNTDIIKKKDVSLNT